MRRLLLLTFAIALACGALISALSLRRQSIVPPHPQTATVQTPASTKADKSDSDDDTDNWPDNAGTPEQVLYAQPQMMRAATARLTSRTPGKVNLYFIGFAGDGDEDVFRNEAEYATKLFSTRFNAAGHTLLLINNPATLNQYPLASLTNLQTAVDATASRMDSDQDVLLLFLTSHGSDDHLLYVSMDPLPLDQIAPEDLADVFANMHIRYKVIVISACYSGGFIDALKNDTTMIITAARTDRASFGCGTDSDITDFGRAFFAEGLNHHDSFTAAFAEASKLVDAWETHDGEKHSFPQISTTPNIEAQLKAWRNGIRLGAPVPFVAPQSSGEKGALTAAR